MLITWNTQIKHWQTKETTQVTSSGSGCMDFRQFRKPQAEVAPKKKGLGLKPPKIGTALPGLDAVVPCCMHSDHMGQLGGKVFGV